MPNKTPTVLLPISLVSFFLCASQANAQAPTEASPSVEQPGVAQPASEGMPPYSPGVPMAPAATADTPAPAMPPPSPQMPAATPASSAKDRVATGVSSKFAATFYGFVEADFIHDSTQSFNDLAGNGTVARSGSYAADHDRMIFGARNSRLGFKLKGPESELLKSSAIVEMDFFGNQPQGSPSPAGSPAVSESAYFVNPTFRIRHMALKLETPIVDILAGQYWELFGWQSNFHPCSVDIQGLPGQVYSRSPQLRLSHTFKSDLVNVEIAVAGVRPPQRNAGLPDAQGGLRILLNDWKGLHTAGGAGTAVDPASIGVSGLARRFRLPEYANAPVQTQNIDGYGLSVDALIPVVPATGGSWDNALTLTGSFVRGQAFADQFSGLTGGTTLASLPADASGKASGYALDIDNGLVVFDANGAMRAIRWQAIMVGLQYYFPTPIRMWVAGNYSHMNSNDIKNLAIAGSSNTASKLFDKSDFADGNFFVDATQSIRFGLEYAWFRQHYLDEVKGTNHRVQLSAFYIF